MKKAFFAVVMLAMLILTGCGETKITFEQDKKASANHESTWSILIYACGDNSGKTSDAIDALTKCKYPENINVVMQTGGSQTWKQSGINGEYVQRYEMQKGSIFLKDQKQSANMGSYETLSDFVSWGMQTYPADKYMLFVIGDGNGIEVVCDELYNNDSLDIEEVYYALSMAPDMLDAICFDASHMASLEMATALPNYAKYMVAGQEKFDGFDYRALVDCIIEYPMAQVEEVCKDICNSYVEKCQKKNIDEMAQISMIDLSQISHLNQIFDAMAREMVSATQTLSDMGAITRLLEVAQRSVDSNMVDISSLAAAVEQLTGDTSSAVRDAIREVVMYNAKGLLRSQCAGISVCYPYNGYIPDGYLKCTISDNYKQFLKNTIPQFEAVDEYITTGAEKTLAYNAYLQQELGTEAGVEGDKYSMSIIGDMALLKNVIVKKYIIEDNQYYSCGETAEVECNWEAQNYKAQIGAPVPVVRGEAVDTRLVSRNAEYSIYSSDILFNGMPSQMYIAYSNESGEYSYVGIWNGGNIEKGGIGDSITLLRKDKASGQVKATKSFNILSGVRVSTEALPDGEYSIEFAIEDIYGKKIMSAPSEFVAEDSNIKLK